MNIIVIALAAASMVLVGGVLVLLRAGITHQEHTPSLTCQPPTLSAALSRRILGLHARGPIAGPEPEDGSLVTGGKGACSS
jgi:hypothetical protein